MNVAGHDSDKNGMESLNCLTIDVEEYFHAEAFAGCLRPQDWEHCERRAAPFVERIAEMLERHRAPATFFVLGWMAERMTPLLRQLLASGHEIACHGDRHAHLSRMTPQSLRDDLHKAAARIEDALGVRPIGYRAPTFSVTRDTAWALDVIIQQGFEYDASIFPIRHDRYGVPNAPTVPFWAVAPSGARILELPPLTADCGVARLPVGGGGYLRLFPGVVLRTCITARQRRNEPAVIYFHPWEMDPHQPRMNVGRLSQWRHRVNMRTTEPKIERLLSTFRFVTMRQLSQRVRAAELPVYRLASTISRSPRSVTTSETT